MTMNTDKINAIISAAATINYVNITEASCQDRYDAAVIKLLKEGSRLLSADEAKDILNRLLRAVWDVEPISIVADGDGVYPDAIECEHWKHLPADGSVLQRAETFGHEVLEDLLRLIGKEAEIHYDDCGWYIEGIYNL